MYDYFVWELEIDFMIIQKQFSLNILSSDMLDKLPSHCKTNQEIFTFWLIGLGFWMHLLTAAYFGQYLNRLIPNFHLP